MLRVTMRYCPSCQTEFVDGSDRCTDCDAELVSKEAHARVMAERDEILTEPYERICTLEDRFEGPVLEQELEADGIRCLIRPFQDSAYDGIFIPQKGWGALFVPERDADRARELIEITRRQVQAEKDSPTTPDDA